MNDVNILAVGPCYISRSNMGSPREDDFIEAFNRAVEVAITENADAVVQLGDLFGTRSPGRVYTNQLERSLERLQEAGIECLHVPSERDADMDQVEEFYETGKLTRVDTSPTWIDDIVFYGIDPDQQLPRQAASISVPDDARGGILASHQPVNPPVDSTKSVQLEAFQSELDDSIRSILVGNADTEAIHTEDPTIIAPGHVEPLLGKWIFYEDARSPYPASVTQLRVHEDAVETSTHTLQHRPLVAIDLTVDSGVGADEVWNELSDLNYGGAAVLLSAWGPPDSEEIVDIVAQRLRENAHVVNTWHNVSNTPVSGPVEVNVERYDPPVETEKRVGIYRCGGRNEWGTSTCQECFSRELFGDTVERETKAGERLVLVDSEDVVGSRQKDTDQFVYGPFTSASDITRNIVPDAWDGDWPYQVEVNWDQLYRLSLAECPISLDQRAVSGDDAASLLDALETDGIPVSVSEDGFVSSNDENPNKGQDDSPEMNQNDSETNGPEGIRDIIKARELSDPLPDAAAVERAVQPGVPILHSAVDGELRPDLYRESLVHLVAGKNVIFYGPPGTGKTRMAKRLCQSVCPNVRVASANAEWTYQEVVGGYKPQGSGFEPTPGVLTEASRACELSLDTENAPEWLIIDELNRANLDEAFGEVFTLLDTEHRHETPIKYADEHTQFIPLAFRILGTMNTEDQAQLFALGYAFRRRFAFVEVPPLYESPPDRETGTVVDSVELTDGFERMNSVLHDVVTEPFEMDDETADTPLGIPVLETVFDPPEIVEAAHESIRAPGSDLSFDRAVLAFVQQLVDANVARIGQGLILDVFRYVVVHHVLFPEMNEWSVVDQGIGAYILPQLEPHMGELRRAETVAAESNAIEEFNVIIERAEELGFTGTADQLREARDTHKIF